MICFKKIKWRNLLSTGNQWTEIDLNKKSNTVIIGTNGAGKSTMLDALTFVLFNKPFRKINKTQLINTVNEKDCLVELEFDVNAREYVVRRGMKPTVFDIEEDENTISILNRYIDEAEIEFDKGIVKNIFRDLYRQACEVE